MGKINKLPIGIGYQDFEKLRANQNFYIDKSHFIMEWWEEADEVTLITRPRRFGKTLNLSMIEKFFSVRYAGREDLFKGLKVWGNRKYRELQGTYPVLYISFADIKETTYIQTRKKICSLIKDLYNQYRFLLEGDLLSENEKKDFLGISADMEDYAASRSIKRCLASFRAIMGRGLLFYWMNMIPPCRKPGYTDFGINWFSLPGGCSILLLRPTHIWSVRF